MASLNVLTCLPSADKLTGSGSLILLRFQYAWKLGAGVPLMSLLRCDCCCKAEVTILSG